MVAQIRHFAPRVVILPFAVGRHPDHRIASELGRDACFLSGLEKYDAPGAPHRPHKILYALSYREDPIKPTFVVDIGAQFDRKLAAIRCYASQFDGAKAAGEIFPDGAGPVRAGGDPERALWVADPGAVRGAVFHPRDHGGG